MRLNSFGTLDLKIFGNKALKSIVVYLKWPRRRREKFYVENAFVGPSLFLKRSAGQTALAEGSQPSVRRGCLRRRKQEEEEGRRGRGEEEFTVKNRTSHKG